MFQIQWERNDNSTGDPVPRSSKQGYKSDSGVLEPDLIVNFSLNYIHCQLPYQNEKFE
jgi:hypothetical protein